MTDHLPHIRQDGGAPQVILAPMSGVTDPPFRRLARRFGPVPTVTEMVAGEMLLRGTQASTRRLMAAPGEDMVVQLLGREPDVMAEAARRAEAAGAIVIDVNFGCPAKKVAGRAAGSALMREADRACAIIAAIADAVSTPVTAKMRLGWDDGDRNAATLAPRLANAGAQGFAVHGRTRAQGYSGVADWAAIADVVSAVQVPVIANGDIRDAADARRCLGQSGARAVMMGRGAQGRPWAPAQAAAALAGRPVIAAPEGAALAALVAEHVELMMSHYGFAGLKAARKHLAWYAVGRREGTAFRQSVFRLERPDAVFHAIESFFASAPPAREAA